MKHTITEGSDNVFADLNLPNPDECLAKSEIVRQIVNIIRKRKLTQKQAAVLLDIDQPKISALMHGRIYSFSLERLFRFLNELGQNITVAVEPVKESSSRGHTTISGYAPKTRVAACRR